MMILADVFPVFCPRVLVPSSSPWSRCADRPEYRPFRKMWYNHHGNNGGPNDEDLRRTFPSFGVSSPEKSFLERQSPFKPLAFSRSPFKTKPTASLPDPFKGFPSHGAVLNAPSFIGHQPPHGDPMSTAMAKYIHRPSLKPPASMAEDLLRSTPSNLQQRAYKRELDITGTKMPFSPEKKMCRPLPSQPHDVCDHRSLKVYRKQNGGPVHNKKIYTCPQCKYVTDRKNNLKRHISTMHQDCSKVLDCCGMVFRSKALLRDHVSLFHRTGYRCQYCGRNFCRKALLRRHLTVHSGQKDFTCPQCGYATSHKSNLERHRKIHDRKYSMNGESVCDDEDSNDSRRFHGYGETLSPVSSSTDSSPNISPVKQYPCTAAESSLFKHEVQQQRNFRGMFTDRLLETYGCGSSGISTNFPVQFKDTIPNVSSTNVVTHKNSDSFSIPNLLKDIPDGFGHKPVTNKCTANGNSITSCSKHHAKQSKKMGVKSTSRLFLTPYKCYDCLAVFSHQRDFGLHNCKPTKCMTSSPPISVSQRKAKLTESSQTERVKVTGEKSNTGLNGSETKFQKHTLSSENTGHREASISITAEITNVNSPTEEGNGGVIITQDNSLPIKKRSFDETEIINVSESSVGDNTVNI